MKSISVGSIRPQVYNLTHKSNVKQFFAGFVNYLQLGLDEIIQRNFVIPTGYMVMMSFSLSFIPILVSD